MAAPTSALASPRLHAATGIQAIQAAGASRRAEVLSAAASARAAAAWAMARMRALEHGLSRAIEWLARAPASQPFAGLSDHLLRDIGLTRDDVARPDPRGPWPH